MINRGLLPEENIKVVIKDNNVILNFELITDRYKLKRLLYDKWFETPH